MFATLCGKRDPLRKLRHVLAILIPGLATGCVNLVGDFRVEPAGDAAPDQADTDTGSDASPIAPEPDAKMLPSDGAPNDRGPTDAGSIDVGDAKIAGDSGGSGDSSSPGGDAGIDATRDASSGGGSDATVAAEGGAPDSGGSDANSVDAHAMDTVSFVQSPTSGNAGAALSAIVVSVIAPGGAVDTKFTGVVTLNLSPVPNPGMAVLGGVLAMNASSGTATFKSVTLSQAGTYAFTATAGTAATTSPTVTISPAVGSWQPASGTVVGGDVRCVAVSPTDPSVAYAGTNGGGIYMTTTGTTNPSWTFIGLPGKSVRSLVIDPTNPRTIYAGADGVYRSNDSGTTWTSVTASIPNIYVQTLAIDPVTTTTLYFGCSLGAYKTTDAGQTWTAILGATDASGPPNVTAIGVAPTSPKVIYAGVYGGSIQESKDGGLTWATLPGVFGPDAGAALWYRTIAVDLVDPTIPYVGFENPALGQGGIWKLTGGAWSLPSGIQTSGMAEVIALRPAGQTSYAVLYGDGLYTSSDGGLSWMTVGSTPFSNVPIALGVAPSNSAIAYGVNYTPFDGHMMHLTTTGGTSWTDASTGIHAYDANSIAVAPTNPSIVYLGGGYNGIHRSTDGASTWTTLPGTTPQNWNGDFYVAVSPTNANVLYAGNNGGGVFKYSDASSASLGVQVQPGVPIMALAVAPSDGQSVYAAAFPGTSGGAYVTANGGTTWANPTLPSALGYGIAIDPSNASIAYVGLGSGAFKTTDHGTTWTELTGIGSFVAMAIDPTNTQSLYAGNGGVTHSGDQGATWAAESAGLPSANVSALAIDPKTPATVYAGFEHEGVWRTTNGGTTWAQIGLAGWTPKAITVDPSTPTTIYIGLAAGGLYKTTTGGL